ncbi:MAG: FtsQ-type POTRA domain-containing protein [Nocardioides sp.]|nr:FtsQ-type POTRA domain-containing protein [Nocardioides sp.]
MLERFRRDAHDPQGSTRRRFVRRQWTRRWLALRVVVAAAVAVLLVVLGVWLIFFSSVLAVQGADVEGAKQLSEDEVLRAAEVPDGRALARVDVDSIAERLEELPAVASADVSRKWPDKLLIKVRERVAVAVVSVDGKFKGMDETGFVFRDFRAEPKALPLVKVDGDVQVGSGAGDETLAEGAAVVAALPRQVARQVEYVELTTIDQISLHLRDGKTVEWGSAAQSEDKGRVLASLLTQDADVYDVTVPGMPTTR